MRYLILSSSNSWKNKFLTKIEIVENKKLNSWSDYSRCRAKRFSLKASRLILRLRNQYNQTYSNISYKIIQD